MIVRIGLCVAVTLVLLVEPSVARTLRFTAMPLTGRLLYFKQVDESKVPRHQGLGPDDTSTQMVTAGALSVPVAFNAQHERYTQGPERPDMGLAVSPRFILQSINSQIAVYDTRGRLMKGWPKPANQFFGFRPGAFMGDTRAQWDTWDHRFWVTFLCDREFCVAVSKTSDPNGVWYSYGFDIKDAQGYEVDFNEFAFDQHTISITSHLGHYFHNSEDLHTSIMTLDKAALESGSQNVVPHGFADLHVAGHDLDTVEPVLVPDAMHAQPPGEFFVSPKGFNFSCNYLRPYCTTVYVFMLSGTYPSQTISGTSIETDAYRYTPLASTPRCQKCLETVGPMMTTSPVYDNGVISFAFGTAVRNATQDVAGIRWGQIAPTVVGSQLTDARLVQSGTLEYSGDMAAFFPSVMTDYAGNFYMIFDGSSSTLNPSVFVAARRATDPLNQLTTVQMIKRGLAPPTVLPWGDYTGGGFSGAGGPAWFASEFAGLNNGYGTEIFNVKF